MLKIGDKLKWMERSLVVPKFSNLTPIIARIDGRAFHSFTRGMVPFSGELADSMDYTAQALLKETGADLSYAQSDEISLVWLPSESELWFGGKLQKMVSSLAAFATSEFALDFGAKAPELVRKRKPTFDARVFFVPTDQNALEYLRWREVDCTKNSISMFAQLLFFHKELLNVPSGEKIKMCQTKGYDWNELDDRFKYGGLFKKAKRWIKFSAEEIDRLPKKHAARTNPGLMVERSVVEVGTRATQVDFVQHI